jgi:hypothetical protein
MGVVIRTTSPAMENHFLLMIFSNERCRCVPPFLFAAFAAETGKSKARAARVSPNARFSVLGRNFHRRNQKWTMNSERQKDSGGNEKKRGEHTRRRAARAALPWRKENGCRYGVLAVTALAIRVTASAVIFVLARHLRLAAKVTAEMAIAIPHILTLAITASMFTSHENLPGKTVESFSSSLLFQASAVPRAQ